MAIRKPFEVEWRERERNMTRRNQLPRATGGIFLGRNPLHRAAGGFFLALLGVALVGWGVDSWRDALESITGPVTCNGRVLPPGEDCRILRQQKSGPPREVTYSYSAHVTNTRAAAALRLSAPLIGSLIVGVGAYLMLRAAKSADFPPPH